MNELQMKVLIFVCFCLCLFVGVSCGSVHLDEPLIGPIPGGKYEYVPKSCFHQVPSGTFLQRQNHRLLISTNQGKSKKNLHPNSLL